MLRRSKRLLAALLVAFALWGAASYRPVHQAAHEQTVPALPVADPGGSGTGNGG